MNFSCAINSSTRRAIAWTWLTINSSRSEYSLPPSTKNRLPRLWPVTSAFGSVTSVNGAPYPSTMRPECRGSEHTDVLIQFVVHLPSNRQVILPLRRWSYDDISPLLLVEISLSLCRVEIVEVGVLDHPSSLVRFCLLFPLLDIRVTFVLTVIPVFVRSDSPVLTISLSNIGLSRR